MGGPYVFIIFVVITIIVCTIIQLSFSSNDQHAHNQGYDHGVVSTRGDGTESHCDFVKILLGTLDSNITSHHRC